MVKVEYFIYIFKLLDILENIHITSCALSKRNVKNNQFYLPSIIEFEVKGNSLGWIPIKVDEDESNLYNIVPIHSQNLSEKDRKRRNLFDNVNFVSGVLSCGNTSATIEPNVIYDADDDYENVEGTPVSENITDENGVEITVGTTVKQSNASDSTSGNKTTVRTTMPTKFYIDECSTEKCPTKTSEVKVVTNECPEITEEYCRFPLIITPPNPLPPLNLDFLTCGHNHSSKTHEKAAMPTKSMEYGGKCPPKHYPGGSVAITTENVRRNKTTNAYTSKKPEHNKKTSKMATTSLSSVHPGNHTETSYGHQEQVGASTLSRLEILFPPLRKIHRHEKTTKSSMRPTHQTSTSKFEQAITTAKTKQTIKTSTSIKVQQTTTPSVQATQKTTKHTSTPKISKSRHRGLSFSFKRDQINDPNMKDISKCSSTWLSKVHPEDNNVDNEEIIKHRAISKLLEKTQHNLEHPKSQVIIRIPSVLGDLPVVIVKDPKIPALSLSVIPSEDNNQVILPLEYPFSLPQPNKLPYTVNFSMFQYRHDNPINVHSQNEDLNGLGIPADINSKLNFNPYSIWPFLASSSVEPVSSKYSLFSKYNFLYPQERKLRNNYRPAMNIELKTGQIKQLTETMLITERTEIEDNNFRRIFKSLNKISSSSPNFLNSNSI